MGSTRAARRAGIHAAASATANITLIALTSAAGSRGPTPKSWLRSRPASPRASGTPAAPPIATSTATSPKNVQRMVLGEVAVLVAMGGAAGVPLALGLAGLLRSQLFGVGPRDPAALVSAISVMLAVALAAAWIPARRAARVDPMVALRYE